MRDSVGPVIALLIFARPARGGPAPARAGPYEDALAGFTTDSFSDTGTRIDAVAASGNPLAVRVLKALQDGRLLFSAEAKKVFYKDKTGKLFDAATGNAVAGDAPADLAEVRAQQPAPPRPRCGARRADPAWPRSGQAHRRGAGGVQIARRKRRCRRSTRRLPTETDSRSGARMEQARAAIVLWRWPTPEADKIAAIDVIHKRGDQEALAMLQGLPADAPAAVRTAADAAISGIQESWRSGTSCRTSGTGFRWVRCCCSPRSASPSPSA